MAFQGLKSFIDQLEKNGELIRVQDLTNPLLEITEITDRISKLPGGGKALLFENTGTRFPLLINALGSEKRMAIAFGREKDGNIEREISELFNQMTAPKGNLWEKLKMLPQLQEVASWMPKRVKGRGTCQEITMDPPDLNRLPVLKCWPADGGRFITLPAVHTVDPVTGTPNVGMYRMQVLDKTQTGMHWHRHKTGAAHFAGYKARGLKMPVSVTLGGDPSYMYAATAPMPENMDEYLLAGFLRKKQVRLVKCLTNDLFVPEDADFVMEGFIDPEEEFILEGPFGDHTGFYSLADYYPRFHITCITHRKDAVYPATIVGIPPMEDAWIGKATERIFLSPIRLTMIPELADMELPFPGVAHNISIVKIHKTYPGQAVKVMNSLWGAGQMMFNKILIVTDDLEAKGREQGASSDIRCTVTGNPCSAIGDKQPATDSRLPSSFPDIHDYMVIARLFRDNFDPSRSLHFSKGPLDILDHSSRKFAFGSKLGVDLTRPFPEEITEEPQETSSASDPDYSAFEKLSGLTGYRDLYPELSLPVLLLSVDKDPTFSKKELESKLPGISGMERFKAVVLFNKEANLDDLFMLVWLVGGNLEPDRDISVCETAAGNRFIMVDATIKTPEHDHFQREWPNVVTMDEQTIAVIDKKWPELGLGEFQPSPSLKYKALVKGSGAVRREV